MNGRVQQVLARYPRGSRGSAQNEFRMVLAAMLKNSLGRRPEIFGSTEEIVAQAISLLHRIGRPGFTPATV
jgi:hypothetical protein